MAACEAAVLGLNPTNIYAGSVEPTYVGLQTQYRAMTDGAESLKAEVAQYKLKYEGTTNIVLPGGKCVMLYPETQVKPLGKFLRAEVEREYDNFKKFYQDYYKERPELYVTKRNYNQYVVCDLAVYAMYELLLGIYSEEGLSTSVQPNPKAKWLVALSSQQLMTPCRPIKQRMTTQAERQTTRGQLKVKALESYPEVSLAK